MNLAILAAEQSADQLGEGILQQLRIPAFGMGGDLLKASGLEILWDPPHVMGFNDVVAVLPKLIKTFYSLRNTLIKRDPKVIVTIDSPDLFLPLHRSLRKQGYSGKLIHLVSPSVWAWRKSRVESLAKTLDLLICLLPFEAPYYHHTSLPILTIDHPLAYDILKKPMPPLTRNKRTKILGLFPGSRAGVIHRNLPIQLEAARHFPDHEVVVCLARESLRPFIPKHLKVVSAQERYALMRSVDCALATSGTICLELALHGVPTSVCYSIAPLSYYIALNVFKIRLPFFTLPNMIIGRGLQPEFIGVNIDAQEVAASLKKTLNEPVLFNELVNTLHAQFHLNQTPYEQAAHGIYELLLGKR